MKLMTLSLVQPSSLLFYFLFISLPAVAQVTGDGTTSTTVTSPDGNNFTINDGNRAGGNLFHSFQDFSVPTNGSAFFNNAVDIDNIISRVTGGSISNIDGLIRANGSANLFLINPAGIIFGSNARLDLGGSFLGSTADSILFPEGELSAVDLDNPPLLTINAPIGLGIRDNPENIDVVNQSSVDDIGLQVPFGLQVPLGETITLVGGDINLTGGRITAPGGRVELGGLVAAGEIGINANGSLSFPAEIARADVTLTDFAAVNVRAGGGGFININAANLTLSEQSQLFAGIAENMGSPEAQAGDITINTTDSVRLIGNKNAFSGFSAEINNNVGITRRIRNNDNPDNDSTAQGNGGSILIDTNFLELSNEARITTRTFSTGNVGDITVNANNIAINQGAIIASLLHSGRGNTGTVTINATDTIFLDGGTDGETSQILAQVLRNGEGDVGGININTGSLLLNNSFILADNRGTGNAGNVTINATEQVSLDTESISPDGNRPLSLILSQIQENNRGGNGGNINISAPLISLNGFSLISSNAQNGARGEAGDINLEADTVRITEGSILDALTENDFNGGDISINANFLELRSGGKIVTANDNGGNAGNINLDIAESIVIDNTNPPGNTPFTEEILQNLQFETGVFANTFPGSIGNGGSIFVQSKTLTLVNEASISAATTFGEGGNITLEINDSITLDNNSQISAAATGSANGGNININTNLILATPNQNSDIIASSEQGAGGRIMIDAEGIIGIEERPLNPATNDINASGGVDGEVIINTPDVDVTQGVIELPTNIVEAETLGANACSGGEKTGVSSFEITGKGGVPPEPTAPINSHNIYIGGKPVNTEAEEVALVKTQKHGYENQDKQENTKEEEKTFRLADIVPARGMIIKENGDVILTAYPTDHVQRTPHRSSNCRQS